MQFLSAPVEQEEVVHKNKSSKCNYILASETGARKTLTYKFEVYKCETLLVALVSRPLHFSSFTSFLLHAKRKGHISQD